ncbi:MAG: dihydrolipoyl dehydrogenase [Cyclobacteriaceae bacterium]|nr:MAG: dihydrolipoyl dehydrogenase [Cyclobacteriaceae bacterium]
MQYDVIVIGSGPGGYIAAIRCAQLGMKTAIVEKYNTLGGTCLNVGCIPSKALLDSSEHYYKAVKEFEEHGITAGDYRVDLERMVKRKQTVVDQTTGGITYLMKKNKIDTFTGVGSFKDKHNLTVHSAKGDDTILTAKNLIIATGSKPASLPFIEIDKKRVITSTEALTITKLPKHMIIMGGGVVGLELGSVFARLGTKITVVELMKRIIPTMDSTMGKELQKVLKKLGFEFLLEHKVTEVKSTARQVTVIAEDKSGATKELKGDYCLVSIGRRPYTQGLGLENVGIVTDKAGRIPVDDHLKTTVDNIYAIGDVIRGAMLAHKAEEEGVLVAEQLAGQKPHINYLLIPGVVYTWPEVASVGHTEEELKEQNIPYKSGSFPFKASARARASMDIDGQVKVLAHEQTDEILGVHIIGPRAADLIGEAVVAMEYRASAEDISRMSHAHPTFSEALKEACLDATGGRALNI